MLKRILIVLASTSVFITLITMNKMESPTHIKPVLVRGSSAIKIHACVRTKNSIRHLDEFIKFHSFQGITSFSFYDDSNKDNSEFFKKYPNVIFYKHVNGIKIRNENHFILECMSRAIISNDIDYVLNMDDDEFLFPTIKGQKIKSLILSHSNKWFESRWCISNALYFFGTIKSNNTGYTTIDFLNRDADVESGDDFMFYYRSYSTRLKKRTEKAIFKVPKMARDKAELISYFGNFMKTGVMIHGYSLDCAKQNKIKVAHYTRRNEELLTRVSTFWENVHGLEKRFNNDKTIENYIKERNRTDVIDTRLHDIGVYISQSL